MMPVLFVSHGTPDFANEESERTKKLNVLITYNNLFTNSITFCNSIIKKSPNNVC